LRLPSEEVQAHAAGEGPNPKGYVEMRNKGSNGYGGDDGGAGRWIRRLGWWVRRLGSWLTEVTAAAVIGQGVVKLLEVGPW